MRIFLLLWMLLYPMVADDDTLQPGETVTGELASPSAEAEYTFTGKTGDKITLTLNSSDFDPFLQLQESDGTEIASNDDFGGSLNATVAATLSADDTYTVIVSSTNGAGSYELTLEVEALALISYGEVIEGELSEEHQTRDYSFNASMGEVITITLESDDFNPYLSLREWYTEYAAVWDDDSGTGTNSFIGPYTVPLDTQFIVTVSSAYALEGGGQFRLLVDRVEVHPAAYGDTIEGEIDESTPYAIYTFEGSAGDRVNVSLESEADLTLKIQNSYGSETAYNDDGGEGANPEIFNQILSSDDTYTLIVRPYAAGEESSFQFTLTGEPAPSLDEGSQTVVLSEKRATDFLTFTGKANTTVRLVLDFTPANLSSTYVSVYQNEVSLAYADTYTYEDFSHVELEFEVPENGSVQVSISDYSLQTVVIQVTLEEVQILR